jgi:hypothetical protein
MEFIIRPTPFTALVFVATKEYPVVDLRIINKLTILDIYPMPL